MKSLVLFFVCLLVVGCSRDWAMFEPQAGGGASDGGSAAGAGGIAGGGGAAGEGGEAGAGGGGSGGGPACGQTEVFRHEAGAAWGEWFGGSTFNVAMDDSSGAVTFVVAAGADDETAYLASERFASLLGSSVSVELTDPPDPSTGNTARLALESIGYNADYLMMEASSGELRAEVELDNTRLVGSKPFDPVQHRFWRIREAAGTVYWETSPDGSAWVEAWSEPTETLFALHHARMALSVTSGLTTMAADTVAFDHLNAEAPPAAWCPAEQLVDDFAGPGLGGAWWPIGSSSLVSVAGTLNLALPWEGVITVDTAAAYDFSASSLVLEVVEPPEGGAYFELFVRQNEDQFLHVFFLDGQLTYADKPDDSQGEFVKFAAPFDPASHRWWRIRGLGQSVAFDTSGDGKSWTERANHPTTLELTRMDVQLMLDNDSPTPRFASVDNVNVLP